MKLHYGGKYEKEEDLKGEKIFHEGSVAFKEPEATKFAILANAGSFVVSIILLVIIGFVSGRGIRDILIRVGFAGIISMALLLPHEFLHALCFKEDVYLYLDPAKMLAFVHGTEDFSKARFVFMSLLPNIVFGVIPYVLFLIHPQWLLLGMTGAVCIGMGCGDYINVFNALTQMPKGSKTYLYGFHSYWHK